MQKSDDSAMQKSLSATSPAETAPKKLHALPRSGCREPLQTKEVWRCFLRTMLRCPFHFCFRIVDDSFCFFLLVFFRHWRENGLAVGCYICIGDRFSENWPQGSGRRTGEVQSHTKHFRNLREIHLQQPKTLGVCAVYRGWTTTQFNMGISSSDIKRIPLWTNQYHEFSSQDFVAVAHIAPLTNHPTVAWLDDSFLNALLTGRDGEVLAPHRVGDSEKIGLRV